MSVRYSVEIKRIFCESIKPLSRFDNSLNPWLTYIDIVKISVKFYVSFLKLEKVALTVNS